MANDLIADRPPTISVVCATYNRPAVLANAVRSVIAQTVTTWELLVVGDAADDETGRTMEAFTDPRVRYYNRPVNHGEQSAPNNDGVGLTSGELVAFLNHDDVWLPDHLERGLAGLRRTGADLVCADAVVVRPDDTVTRLSSTPRRFGKVFEPSPASLWLFRRSLFDEIGPWHSAFELRCAPSLDWYCRAVDAGAAIESSGATTVVIVPSAGRTGSYVSDADTTESIGVAVLEHGLDAVSDLPRRRTSVVQRGRRRVWQVLALGIARAGFHPILIRLRIIHLVRGWQAGDYIRSFRANRGLPDDPSAA